MPKDDLVYIGHMYDMTAKVIVRIDSKTRDEFDEDEDLRIVLAHLLQTIGEAARRVSAAYQQQHPEIPWSSVIGMRHKIVHDYLTVDYDIVWDVATIELPQLMTTLARLLSLD